MGPQISAEPLRGGTISTELEGQALKGDQNVNRLRSGQAGLVIFKEVSTSMVSVLLPTYPHLSVCQQVSALAASPRTTHVTASHILCTGIGRHWPLQTLL